MMLKSDYQHEMVDMNAWWTPCNKKVWSSK